MTNGLSAGLGIPVFLEDNAIIVGKPLGGDGSIGTLTRGAGNALGD
jgi:hypothetical protein